MKRMHVQQDEPHNVSYIRQTVLNQALKLVWTYTCMQGSQEHGGLLALMLSLLSSRLQGLCLTSSGITDWLPWMASLTVMPQQAASACTLQLLALTELPPEIPLSALASTVRHLPHFKASEHVFGCP